MMTVDLDRLSLVSGQRVLDLGCGEGRHTLGAHLGHEITVIGMDLSTQDLATAVSRVPDMAPFDPVGEVCFACGDALQLPFPDRSFDRVICSEVLEHIPNYLAVLDEIDRVLKPGGKLCISVPRGWPEHICWRLSWRYHNTPGGHIRIFNSTHLRREIERLGLRRYARHGAHALHVPYWWLRCLFWQRRTEHWLVAQYHRLLVWDLMEAPGLTRTLEAFLNPWLGKSVVQYFDKPRQPRRESLL